jgi:hypothetical protein
VQLQVTLPDLLGRRDILRIHTRAMRQNGALAPDAAAWIEEGVQCAADGVCAVDEAEAASLGLAACTKSFSGAELAGLVRSAASFALGRSSAAAAAAAAVGGGGSGASSSGEGEGVQVTRADFELALREVTPALRARDGALRAYFAAHGVGCAAHAALRRELLRLVLAPAAAGAPPRPRSALLVAEGAGAGATAAAAWAAATAAERGAAEFTTLCSTVELTQGGGASVAARCAALTAAVAEAAAMGSAVLVRDPCAIQATTLCHPGCNSVPSRLQPCVSAGARRRRPAARRRGQRHRPLAGAARHAARPTAPASASRRGGGRGGRRGGGRGGGGSGGRGGGWAATRDRHQLCGG